MRRLLVLPEHALLSHRRNASAGFAERGDETDEQKLGELERGLGLAGLKLADAVPFLAPMLSVPFGEKYPPLTLSPEQQRQRLFATLAAWLFGAASRQLHRGLR